MKLKHYLGALLMAGSVVAISFPADATPGIRLCQRLCQRYAPPLAKTLEKTISKPNINRAINLIPRSQVELIKAELIKAKPITDKIAIGSKVPLKIPTPDITSELPQLASPPPVVPTQPTLNEQELKQDIISRSGIAVVETINVSIGTFVHLNSQNANSERPQIRVSEVRTPGSGKLKNLIRLSRDTCNNSTLCEILISLI